MEKQPIESLLLYCTAVSDRIWFSMCKHRFSFKSTLFPNAQALFGCLFFFVSPSLLPPILLFQLQNGFYVRAEITTRFISQISKLIHNVLFIHSKILDTLFVCFECVQIALFCHSCFLLLCWFFWLLKGEKISHLHLADIRCHFHILRKEKRQYEPQLCLSPCSCVCCWCLPT